MKWKTFLKEKTKLKVYLFLITNSNTTQNPASQHIYLLNLDHFTVNIPRKNDKAEILWLEKTEIRTKRK